MSEEAQSFSSLAKALRSKRELLCGNTHRSQENKISRVNHPLPSTSGVSVQQSEKEAMIARMKIVQCPPLNFPPHSPHEASVRFPSISPQVAPASKDSLLLSAGTVRERSLRVAQFQLSLRPFFRYRELRKGEEKKVTDRHSRILKRHAATMKSSFPSREEESREEQPPSASEEVAHEELTEFLGEPSYPPDTTFLSDLSYTKVADRLLLRLTSLE
jgi:hypothetical protein